MSDEFGSTPPPVGGAAPEQPWTQTSYTAPPQPPPGYLPPPVAGSGLSDTAAGAIAYLTFIPALLFLLIDPYRQKPSQGGVFKVPYLSDFASQQSGYVV